MKLELQDLGNFSVDRRHQLGIRHLRTFGALAVACVLCCLQQQASAADAPATCKPQGLLKLAPPFGKPVNSGGLAFCQQYQKCTCCEHSHSALIYNSMKHLQQDTAFSAQCKAYLNSLACRVCDPLVGVGQTPAVCRGFCNGWLSACGDEYFAFHLTSGLLTPCTEGSQTALLCTRAKDLAATGTAFCDSSGLLVSDDATRCWSGAGAAILDSCKPSPEKKLPQPSPAGAKSKPTKSKPKQNKSAKQKAKARNKRAAGASYSTADTLMLLAVVAISAYAGWRFWNGGGLFAASDSRFPGAAHQLGGGERTAKHRR